MDSQYVQLIDAALAILTKTNVAAPIVFATIAMVVNGIKAVTGSGPTLLEVIAQIEVKLDSNDTAIRAEIARLKLLLATA